MTDEGEINIFRALDFIRDNAPAYAQAKAQRVYLENFRKSKKALLMRAAEIKGHKTAAIQEREAYADPEYIETLAALQIATEEEERLRWLITAAEAKIEAWRTIESTRRAEARAL
ncbi:hypothetical protein [Paraburkholderia atlantica]|uniref:hypothetical protein n=1 Tax=Paraburkholderia atlantica TaxID=2654982 RepID=UPI001830DAB8|nr:hypothetical protein [Paraburkholderia atlantica]MBB5414082.1 hypothetical protein [Paraburkholderia atlantica]